MSSCFRCKKCGLATNDPVNHAKKCSIYDFDPEMRGAGPSQVERSSYANVPLDLSLVHRTPRNVGDLAITHQKCDKGSVSNDGHKLVTAMREKNVGKGLVKNVRHLKRCGGCLEEMRKQGVPQRVMWNKAPKTPFFCEACPEKPHLCQKCFNIRHAPQSQAADCGSSFGSNSNTTAIDLLKHSETKSSPIVKILSITPISFPFGEFGCSEIGTFKADPPIIVGNNQFACQQDQSAKELVAGSLIISPPHSMRRLSLLVNGVSSAPCVRCLRVGNFYHPSHYYCASCSEWPVICPPCFVWHNTEIMKS